MLCINRIFAQTWGDLAGEIPGHEYWKDVISATNLTHPGFLFLAEAYWGTEEELLKLGFDACYDKVLYDILLTGSANDLLSKLSLTTPPFSRLVHFMENHDETRARTAYPARREALGAIAITTTPGIKLIHEGQMDGRRIRIPVFLSRRPVELPDPDRQLFYRTLLRIASSPLCRDGEWQICTRLGWDANPSFQNLAAWSWHDQHETLVVVLNFSEHPSQSLILLPWEDLEGFQWKLVDLIKGNAFQRDGGEIVRQGLFVDLPGWDFHLLWCSARNALPNSEQTQPKGQSRVLTNGGK
jgi:hypothetical protein